MSNPIRVATPVVFVCVSGIRSSLAVLMTTKVTTRAEWTGTNVCIRRDNKFLREITTLDTRTLCSVEAALNRITKYGLWHEDASSVVRRAMPVADLLAQKKMRGSSCHGGRAQGKI